MIKKKSTISTDATKSTLSKLKDITSTLRTVQSKRQILELTIRVFLQLGFDRVRVYLVDEDKKKLYGAASSYLPHSVFSKVTPDLRPTKKSPGLTRGLATKKPFYNPKNPTLTHILKDKKAKDTIGFPLVSGKRVFGVISVDNALSKKPLNLKSAEVIAEPFVNHIALVLHRVLAEQEIKKVNRELKEKVKHATTELEEKNRTLEYIALHDELTGLPNRRHFNQYMEESFAIADKKRPLALAMMDLDFLKHINDTQGHLVGDKVIAAIGKILRESRSITYAARYAGDEFVILLPGRHHPADLHLMERIRKKILKEVRQSVSIGIASYPNDDITSSIDLIRKADDALYHAKHTGRGKTVCCANTDVNILSAEERKRLIQRLEAGGTIVADYIGHLEVLNDISKKLQSTKSETEINRAVLGALKKKLGFQRMRMYRVDKENDLMVCTYATGVRKSDLSVLNRRLSDKKSLAAKAAKTGKVIDSQDPKYTKFLNPLLKRMFGTSTTIIVPLMAQHNIIGSIVGDYDPSKMRFDKTSHQLLRSIGSHIALALQQVQLIEQIQEFNKDLEQRVAAATTKLRNYSSSLEQQIQDNQELRDRERQAHFDIISALVVSLESKDVYTRGHSARVAKYASRLGRAIGMVNHRLTELRYGALLHDIGKLSIDARLLNKKQDLTKEEIMKLTEHPVIGGKIVASVRFLKEASVFVRHHHERWDGLGYPDGLKEEEIPIEARIINIADSYDAMVTRRSYGKKMTKKEAMTEFRKGRGKQFDPALADAFIALIKKSRV